ncbi:MAG: pentapeptide repeat-containing protein [Hyphomonas sp.]
MDAKNPKNQLNAIWLKTWWDNDFTWEGLKTKPLQGWVVANGYLCEAATGRIYGETTPSRSQPITGMDANLQDYWRADPVNGKLRSDEQLASELVSVPQQPCFHRVHLPLRFQDGTPSGKELWADNALDAVISPRLTEATEMDCEAERLERELFGPDVRAQFQGGILLCAPNHPLGIKCPLSVRYDFAAFCRDAIFEYATFAGEAVFDSVIFSAEARFDHSRYLGDASFEYAVFAGEAKFSHVTFLGDARFEQATFAGRVNFERATFAGDAIFQHVDFLENAGFSSAVFSSLAYFESATFFEDAGFDSATMFDEANFDNTTFEKRFAFLDTTFGRNAFFVSARINSNESAWRGAFAGCLFERLTDWSNVERFEPPR